MKTNVVEKGQWTRELEVEIPAERIEPELNKAYRKYQGRLNVPGFRKGKVPLRIIRARFGESISGEVIKDLLPTFLEEAMREAGLAPAAPPTISKLDHKPGRDLTFTVELDIWPEIATVRYEGLEVTKRIHEVTDAEVEEQLVEIQNRQAIERSAERPLKKGDVLIADLQRLDDGGVPIIGEKYEGRRFLIGQDNAPSPEFEEALIGLSAGEERAVRFTYRTDLDDEQLAGSQGHFMVVAREVRERTLPELDDELAKDLGDQFQSLDELRQHLRGQLEQRWEYMARQQLRSELIDRLIARNAFELPESLVDHYLDSLHREQEGGHDHDHDHDHDHEHSEEERRFAKRQLRRYLLLEAVRKQAGVEVSDEAFLAFLAQRAAETGAKVEDLQRSERLDDLRRELEEIKIIDLLVKRARIDEQTM